MKPLLQVSIGLTYQCTQSCRHCGYNCSPQNNIHLTWKHAVTIRKLLDTLDDTTCIFITGGECFCHPEYESLFDILCSCQTKHTQVMTTGDWMEDYCWKQQVRNIFSKYRLSVFFALDSYHTCKNVYSARDYLKDVVVNSQIEGHERQEYELYPIGRSQNIRTSVFCKDVCVCKHLLQECIPRQELYIDPHGDVYSCSLKSYCFRSIDTFTIEQFYEFYENHHRQFLDESENKSCLGCLEYFKERSYV